MPCAARLRCHRPVRAGRNVRPRETGDASAIVRARRPFRSIEEGPVGRLKFGTARKERRSASATVWRWSIARRAAGASRWLAMSSARRRDVDPIHLPADAISVVSGAAAFGR